MRERRAGGHGDGEKEQSDPTSRDAGPRRADVQGKRANSQRPGFRTDALRAATDRSECAGAACQALTCSLS
jgi:hypothetical protein